MSASTRSFTNHATVGSDPNTLQLDLGRGLITVDLSALAGAKIYRATLDPFVTPKMSDAEYDIRPTNLPTPLPLLGPRFITFDATNAVRQAIASGQQSLSFNIINRGQGFGQMMSLNVTSNQAAPQAIQQVSGVSARHQNGDTMLTFQETAAPFGSNGWTVGNYENELAKHAADQFPKHRYRIYRASVPFTNANVWDSAELIDEILPLSGWNGHIMGDTGRGSNKLNQPIPRLPINDNSLAPIGKGVYVHRASANQTAHYFVSYVKDGAEDLSAVQQGGNASAAVSENTGTGMTLLWKSDRVQGTWGFSNNMNMRLDYYVRWAAPPNWNTPSEPFNYRVGVPMGSEAKSNPPLTVHLHSWGKHMDIWSRWPHYANGAILLNPTLNVYNAYTAYHQHRSTLKSWKTGTAQPYVQARILDFMHNFLYGKYNIDRQRIALYGESMGGAGTHMFGMRSGHIFSHLLAGVGHNIPAEDPRWLWQFENVGGYGKRNWNVTYSNAQLAQYGYAQVRPQDNYQVWDYFDNRDWLEKNRTVETPYISFSNAPNDTAIGWEQAWKVAQAVKETKRPHNFSWGQRAHGQPIEPMPIPFKLNQSLLAFSNGTLDDPLGTSPAPGAVVPEGQLNRYMRWTPATLVDTVQRYEVDIFLDGSSPANAARADVTLRRLQNFRVQPNQRYTWAWDGNEIEAVADSDGLLTIPNLLINKVSRRLVVVPVGGNTTPTPIPGTGTGSGSGDGSTGGTPSGSVSLVTTPSVEQVAVGENVSYTYQVRNNGTADITDVTLRVNVDANTSFVWSDSVHTRNGDQFSFDFARIAPGQTGRAVLVVRVDATAGNAIQNTAVVTGSGVNATASISTQVTGGGPLPGGSDSTAADLAISVKSSADTILSTSKVSYTTTITNKGAGVARNIVLTHTIDPNSTHVWCSVDNGDCLVVNDRVVCSIPVLQVGDSVRAIIVVQPDADFSGTMRQQIAVVADQSDPVGSNNQTTVETAVTGNTIAEADLQVTMKASESEISGDQTVTFTVNVRNDGPSAAENIVVTNMLHPNATFVWSDAADQSLVADTVVCRIPSLAVGATQRILVVVRAQAGFEGWMTLRAAVSADQSDPNETDNRKTTGVQVRSAQTATLSAQMVASTETVAPGDTISYTIILNNTGTTPVNNVRIVDALTAEASYVWSNITTGTVLVGANEIIGHAPQLNPGAEMRAIFVVRVAAGASGTLHNIVMVQADNTAAQTLTHTATIQA